MDIRENNCLACDGSGLLMDDEQWHYICTICGGSGLRDKQIKYD